MSFFYYKFVKYINQTLNIFELFYLQIFKFLLYALFVMTLEEFFKNPNLNNSTFNRKFILALIIYLAARFITLHLRKKIEKTTTIFKNSFNKRDLELLKKEIEIYIDKSISFTKWCCGILATVVTLLITIFSNIIINNLDKVIPQSNLKMMFNNTEFLNNILIIFAYLLFLNIALVLGCYFTIQFFTYYKRLAYTILKNCEYEEDILDSDSKIENIYEFLKELFFIDYIK